MTSTRYWTIKPNEATVAAAKAAMEVQNACSLLAITGALHRHMKCVLDANKADDVEGFGGDELNLPYGR